MMQLTKTFPEACVIAPAWSAEAAKSTITFRDIIRF
jgi:hypothetical protein